MKYAMGVVGLGVMGANLARNIESRGFPVVGYDLDAAKTQAFVNGPAKGKAVAAADSPANLMAMLEQPRRILVMVPAGKPVDSVIAHLKPHLEAGDILIDGGNSFFVDTDRRVGRARLGRLPLRRRRRVSGGEEGALHGPAIMPGGPKAAWDALSPILRAIAAKADDGEPCVALHGAARRRALREDGAQRDRVRRHAAHRRDLRPAAPRRAASRPARSPTSSRQWNEAELRPT